MLKARRKEAEELKFPDPREGLPEDPRPFVGASHEEAAATVQEHLSSRCLVAVVGPTGSGKSTVVRRAANSRWARQWFLRDEKGQPAHRRFWVDLEDCAPGKECGERVTHALARKTFSEALARIGAGPCLLVLDNADSAFVAEPGEWERDDTLAALADCAERGASVVVTRRRVSDLVVGRPWTDVIEVPGFDRDEDATDLFLSRAPRHVSDLRLGDIVAACDRLPQAVILLSGAAADGDLEIVRRRVAPVVDGLKGLDFALPVTFAMLDGDDRAAWGALSLLPSGLSEGDVRAVLAWIDGARERLIHLYTVGVVRRCEAGVRVPDSLRLPPVAAGLSLGTVDALWDAYVAWSQSVVGPVPSLDRPDSVSAGVAASPTSVDGGTGRGRGGRNDRTRRGTAVPSRPDARRADAWLSRQGATLMSLAKRPTLPEGAFDLACAGLLLHSSGLEADALDRTLLRLIDMFLTPPPTPEPPEDVLPEAAPTEDGEELEVATSTAEVEGEGGVEDEPERGVEDETMPSVAGEPEVPVEDEPSVEDETMPSVAGETMPSVEDEPESEGEPESSMEGDTEPEVVAQSEAEVEPELDAPAADATAAPEGSAEDAERADGSEVGGDDTGSTESTESEVPSAPAAAPDDGDDTVGPAAPAPPPEPEAADEPTPTGGAESHTTEGTAPAAPAAMSDSERAVRTARAAIGLRIAARLEDQRRFGTSALLAEAVVAAARRSGDESHLAEALSQLGRTERFRADYASAGVHLDEALRLFESRGDGVGLGTVRFELGLIDLELGHLDGAESHLEAACQRFATNARAVGEANARLELVRIDLAKGRLDQAQQRLSSAIHGFQEAGDSLGYANASLQLGQVELARGRVNDAERKFANALDGYEQAADKVGFANACLQLGQVELARGQLDRAERRFGAALAGYEQVGEALGIANVSLQLGQVDLARGRWLQSEQRLMQALSVYQQLGDRIGVANATLQLSQVALGRGVAADAASKVQAAQRAYDDIGDVLGSANARQVRALVCQAQADNLDAAAFFVEAARLYDSIGRPANAGVCLAGAARVSPEGTDRTDYAANAARHLRDAGLDDAARQVEAEFPEPKPEPAPEAEAPLEPEPEREPAPSSRWPRLPGEGEPWEEPSTSVPSEFHQQDGALPADRDGTMPEALPAPAAIAIVAGPVPEAAAAPEAREPEVAFTQEVSAVDEAVAAGEARAEDQAAEAEEATADVEGASEEARAETEEMAAESAGPAEQGGAAAEDAPPEDAPAPLGGAPTEGAAPPEDAPPEDAPAPLDGAPAEEAAPPEEAMPPEDGTPSEDGTPESATADADHDQAPTDARAGTSSRLRRLWGGRRKHT